MIPAESTPISTSVRHNKWSTTHLGTDGKHTTWFGLGNQVGVNVTNFFVSDPLAARKIGRGLGARKRRLRQSRVARRAAMAATKST